jgi:hypothetical protein
MFEHGLDLDAEHASFRRYLDCYGRELRSMPELENLKRMVADAIALVP